MAFLSEIVGKPVYDSRGHKVGALNDVAIPVYQTPFPTLSAIQVGKRWVPWNQVKSLDGKIELKVAGEELAEYALKSHEMRLRQEVLDHQVLDIEGRKVRRVNDLALSRTNGHYSLVGVDISARGLLRRFGLSGVVQRVHPTAEELIAWADVDPVRSDPNMGVRLRRSRQAISRLHPSDLADIVEELTVTEGISLLEKLDDEHAADVLEEVEEERQADILEQMESERAADILEEMAPDDAADVLAEMDPEKAQEVLNLMEGEAHQDVTELLGYEETSAGGIMTTDYVAVAQTRTAQEILQYIRTSCRDIDMVYNVYVVKDVESEELVGAVTLRDLIMADPEQKVSTFMNADPPKVRVSDHQSEVARTIAKYNLMSIPVVNDAGQLQGIVTVDDAVDILLPTAWKKRLPRIF